MCYAVRNMIAGTIFKQKGTSSKKMELRLSSTTILFKENMKILIKTLTVSVYPKNYLK